METFILPKGLEIDLEEGWKKLISRQFGGDAGRGFGELIQNLLDSYPSGTPWENRIGEIRLGNDFITITDFGEGLDRKRLNLLTTLGGTDKKEDPSKIGKFGIGFFSIFNPALGAKLISVTTKCEGYVVELLFKVIKPGQRPELSYNILDIKIPYSTYIRIDFDNTYAPEKCLKYAEKSLKYYPCNINIDGKKFKSVWDQALNSDAFIFKGRCCDGFIEKRTIYNEITLLCKYEYLMYQNMTGLITGGHDVKYDLRDYYASLMPFLPGFTMYLNSNSLNVTISRDSFYMDYAYIDMKKELSRFMMEYLVERKLLVNNDLVILANQYIFRNEIKKYLNKTLSKEKILFKFVETLVESKVYRINGKKEIYSIKDIDQKLNKDWPLFFSPDNTNLRWLGGEFKHDFIVLPPKCYESGSTPQVYDTIFACVFENIVNLDTIENDGYKLKKLVEQDIIHKSALSPRCEFIGIKTLNKTQQLFLNEIQIILKNDEIKKVIENNIKLSIRTITPVFFSVESEGAYISTGLFLKEGVPLDESYVTNLMASNKKGINEMSVLEIDVLLGLRLNHPFISYLIEKEDHYRSYYTLTYLAHELALCQRVLVPFSPFYHFIKEQMSQDMRKVLIKQIITQNKLA